MKIYFLIFVLLFSFLPLHANVTEGLQASYTFNNGNTKDDVHGFQAEFFSTLPSKDRFGNKNHALYLQGTNSSYIILGNNDTLKPISGTISLWVKIENPIYGGRGVQANPIIMTKSNTTDDFFEAYTIVFDIGSNKLNAGGGYEESNQVGCRTVDEIDLHTWYHVALSFNDDSLWFYVDGELITSIVKKFRTKYVKDEPVIIGSYANSKNERYLNGYVDDVKIYNRVLNADEILQLYNAPNPVKWKIIFKYILIVVAALIALLLIIFISRMRIRQVLKKEQEKNKLIKKSQEQEIRMLKSQMDPHFIFNSLNSIQQLIIKNENRKAQSYLTKFSRLLRKSIESNVNDSISLQDEIDILNKYIEMESLRFETEISTELNIDDNIDLVQIQIPPMMLQPLVENAIWHGLLPKQEGDKKIYLRFYKADAKTLSCIVEDNGVGFSNKKNNGFVKKDKSYALQFIRQRLELMSEIYKQHFTITILEKVNDNNEINGTTITLYLPILIKENHESNNN